MVTDLLPWLPNVGPSAKHTLKSYDSDREIVNSYSVVLSAHNLWGHVARSSGCVLRIVRSPDSSNTKVSCSKVAIIIDNYVLWLDIPMNDVLIVDKLKGGYDARYKELWVMIRSVYTYLFILL